MWLTRRGCGRRLQAEIADPSRHDENEEAQQENELAGGVDEAELHADGDAAEPGDREHDAEQGIDLLAVDPPCHQRRGDNGDAEGIGAEGGVALRPIEIKKHGQTDDGAAGAEHAERQAREGPAEDDSEHCSLASELGRVARARYIVPRYYWPAGRAALSHVPKRLKHSACLPLSAGGSRGSGFGREKVNKKS